MRNIITKLSSATGLALLGAAALAGYAHAGANGTTLSAVKTIDICDTGTTSQAGTPQWRYSGEISVANGGAVTTQGLNIFDAIQTKSGGTQFDDVPGLSQTVIDKGAVNQINILPNTQMTFNYNILGDAIPTGPIRNRAAVTITNHSGHLGIDFGPEPKVTWAGTDPLTGANVPPLCAPAPSGGCTLTQGYWKNHTSSWPSPYDPNNLYYSSTKTWLGVLNTAPQGNGYYILADQYIAALLNIANGAPVPASLQQSLDDAQAFFAANLPSSCTSANQKCNQQKAIAAVLDDYNNGIYNGGPPHCGQ